MTAVRIDIDKLAAQGLTLRLEDPEGRPRTIGLGPSGAVTGYYHLEADAHRIRAVASHALTLTRSEWHEAAFGLLVPAHAVAKGVRVDLTIPRGGGRPLGLIAVASLEAAAIELHAEALGSEPIVVEGVEVDGAKLTFEDGGIAFEAKRVSAALITLSVGGLSVTLEGVSIARPLHFEDGRLELKGLLVELARVVGQGFSAEVTHLELPRLVELQAGNLRVERVLVGGTEVEVDLARLLARPSPAAASAVTAPRALPDLGLLDQLNGKLDVDVTADTTIPLIGRRRATHHFRVAIDGGAIDFKRLEKNLAALEDSVLDFVVKDDELRLVKDIPLVPWDTKTLVFWPLAEDERELARKNRVRLRRLAHYRLPPGSAPKRPSAKPGLEVRSLCFDNIDLDVKLRGPASLALAGVALRLGDERHAAIGRLRVSGSVQHHARGKPVPTTLRIDAENLHASLSGVELPGGATLTLGALALGAIDGATVTFADVKPSALRLVLRDTVLRGLSHARRG
jgi:hypothetical protein